MDFRLRRNSRIESTWSNAAFRRDCFDLVVRLTVAISLLGLLIYPRPKRYRAVIQPIEELKESPDACVAVSVVPVGVSLSPSAAPAPLTARVEFWNFRESSFPAHFFLFSTSLFLL